MLELSINNSERLITVAHALSSEVRVNILKLLNNGTMNIIEIANALHIPVSTAALNIKVLENAKLIQSELLPASRGAMKVCSRTFDEVHMVLNTMSENHLKRSIQRVEMPIGQYADCQVVPGCGFADQYGVLSEDDPVGFFYPNHVHAQLIWFHRGYMEYKFPLSLPNGAEIQSIQFSMELCSEVPYHDNQAPSDITLWLNGLEVATWQSPGDFGDRRGRMTPPWWSKNFTQYGLLKTWKIDRLQSYIDDVSVSKVNLDMLSLEKRPTVMMRIGVKPDAEHQGGINLFDRHFGDYSQGIVMEVNYSDV